ncbi:MAG: hypothetical protein FWH01_16655, partial [Oscillospiraceae bacterium]|nr:hypothetical protein [Oscillospiraceae bacterium]
MELTHRERFDRLFKGEPVDRAPFLDYMGKCNFPSCLSRWKTEGLKADADADDVRNMMGFDYGRGYYIPVKTLVYPEFEVKVVKREGEKVYTRNAWGGLEILKEGSELMPIAIDGIVKDRYSWDAVKERLKGDAAPRLPDNFDSICEEAKNSGLPVYAGDRPAGFFGAPRELCGFENLIFMFYDDPKLLAEILETLCDLWISVFTEILKRVRLDYIFIWEDMCSKNGPLISPAMFREFLLPNYKRLTSALKTGGCEHFIVDSDGDERPLVTLWQEGGVNIVFPWESQFGLDMV